jgi:hypothetical protein
LKDKPSEGRCLLSPRALVRRSTNEDGSPRGNHSTGAINRAPTPRHASPITHHPSRITHHPSRITGFPLPIAQMFFCICSYFKNNNLTFTMNQCKYAIGPTMGFLKTNLTFWLVMTILFLYSALDSKLHSTLDDSRARGLFFLKRGILNERSSNSG